MSRRTKTLLPTTATLLQPKVTEDQHRKLLANHQRQAKYYDRGTKQLPDLSAGGVVRMYQGSNKADLLKAAVQSKVGPRSYEVVTEEGKTF